MYDKRRVLSSNKKITFKMISGPFFEDPTPSTYELPVEDSFTLELYVTDGTYSPTILDYNVPLDLESSITIVSSDQDLPDGSQGMRIVLSYTPSPNAYELLYKNFDI